MGRVIKSEGWGGGQGRVKWSRSAAKVFRRDRNVVRLGKGRGPDGSELGVGLSHFQTLGASQLPLPHIAEAIVFLQEVS